MDISAIDTVSGSNKGAEMTVLTPKREKTDIKIQLHGLDSNHYRDAVRDAKSNRIKLLNDEGRQTLTADELENEEIDILVACTSGWKNVEFEGKPLDATTENIRYVYVNFPDIRRQADRFIGKTSNFLP